MPQECSKALLASYDYRLVAFSIFIAVFASYSAIDLAGRITASRGRARLVWLTGGAFAMGSGVWAMHYTGMLAFRMPIPVFYHVPTVLLSLVAAVLACFIALAAVGRERITPLRFATGSLLMGIGIATMHYTGMAAMRVSAMHHYNCALLLLSILLAIGISLAGLLLLARFRQEKSGFRPKLATALIMGLAIPVMHYTGMAAVTFFPMPDPPDLSWSVSISGLANTAILLVVPVILGFSVITSVVDRRLSAQQSALENERTILRALIDNIPDFMYVKDIAGRFVLANRHLADAVGAHAPEELLGKTDFDIFPPESATALHANEQTVIASGQPLYNREGKSAGGIGEEVHILTTTVPLKNVHGQVTGIAAVGRDISHLKKAEDALRTAHREAEIFINTVPSVLVGVDCDSVITRWNKAAGTVFALSATEVLGKPLGSCGIAWLRPDMEREIQSWCAQRQLRACDAIPFGREGKTRLLGLTITPVYANDQGVAELLLIGSDITDRHSLEEQLRQAQKLESIGQLAAGIAHEINTPTQYIGDNVRFLKDAFSDILGVLTEHARLLAALENNSLNQQVTDSAQAAFARTDMDYLKEEIPKAIEQALEGVSRVATLVKAMKEFSHPGTKEKTPQNLNHAIENTITVARNEWKYVADLDTELDPTLPVIDCYVGEFNQAVLNLIVNAAHAIAERVGKDGSTKGRIKVQTLNCRDYAEIRIQDNGSGIPEKIRSRIFDPFFTTKEVGKGTGQGLAIARSVVVDKHGGTIHFETTEGVGTTFIIRIPSNPRAHAASTVSS
jgi:PAS domain S-box-containing protein